MEAPVQPGDVLAGKYRVESVLGAGGMGVVVAATHLQLEQRVALKFLLPQGLADPDIVGRFMREARAAVRLKSEHVARIIDIGTLETGSPFIVMEFLEGQDLSQLLHQEKQLPIAVAVDYILQACDAVAEAHSLGVVHRDLKPANLFLTHNAHGLPLVKVLDFGISKSLKATDFSLTRTTAIMGSPAYMSPEQMRSAKNVDERTDIWSLGVILFELVTGQSPFLAESFTELAIRVATEPLPPMPRLPGGTPPGFDAVIRRTLEKDPKERFASIGELAAALAPYTEAASRDLAMKMSGVKRSASSHAMTDSASRLGPEVAPPLTRTTLGQSSGETLSRTKGTAGKRTLIYALAAVGVLAGGVTTWFAIDRGDPRAAVKPAALPDETPGPPIMEQETKVEPTPTPTPTPPPVVTPLPATEPDAGVAVSAPPVEPAKPKKGKKPPKAKPANPDDLFNTPD